MFITDRKFYGINEEDALHYHANNVQEKEITRINVCMH